MEIADSVLDLIGDTPLDVECAGAIIARTFAVESGVYAIEELQWFDPWRVFSELPSPDAFVSLIDDEGGVA